MIMIGAAKNWSVVLGLEFADPDRTQGKAEFAVYAQTASEAEAIATGHFANSDIKCEVMALVDQELQKRAQS